LVEQASDFLPIGGSLILYGPFRRNGSHTSLSNESFDQSLKDRNPLWGVRDLEAVETLCIDFGFTNMRFLEMPANNLMVSVFKTRQ
jgi:hypothetical protein